jgi:hypothetical protein
VARRKNRQAARQQREGRCRTKTAFHRAMIA